MAYTNAEQEVTKQVALISEKCKPKGTATISKQEDGTEVKQEPAPSPDPVAVAKKAKLEAICVSITDEQASTKRAKVDSNPCEDKVMEALTDDWNTNIGGVTPSILFGHKDWLRIKGGV